MLYRLSVKFQTKQRENRKQEKEKLYDCLRARQSAMTDECFQHSLVRALKTYKKDIRDIWA